MIYKFINQKKKKKSLEEEEEEEEKTKEKGRHLPDGTPFSPAFSMNGTKLSSKYHPPDCFPIRV